MKCPYCGDEESKVIDSRPTEDGERIRRRRECLRCRMRFTTYEVVETVPLIVIKKDNSREPFDRQKLLNAMLRACAKRPVSYDALERAVSSIEQSLMSSYDREVSSVRIGELTMQELKKIDEGLCPLCFGLSAVCRCRELFHGAEKADGRPQREKLRFQR